MITLVTAIYGHGPASIIGGRGRGVYYFNSSLRNITNLDLPIIIYTDVDNVDIVERHVSQYMRKYKIIPYNLEEFEFSQQVIEYKTKIFSTIDLNDRNHLLCYNKPFWVKDAIEKNYFNTEKFLWIDSGLTHHGLIPEKVGGVELFTNPPNEIYYPLNPNNIFTPLLAEKLNNVIAQDKLLFCALPLVGGCDNLVRITKECLNIEVPYIGDHLIGGIFGGYKDAFIKFYNVYHKMMKYCVDNEILLLEEPLFSCIQAALPEMFDVHKFYTWYFYSPGESNHTLTQEGDSFYKVLTKLLA